VLDLIWALNVLRAEKATPEWVLKLFDLPKNPKGLEVPSSALKKSIKVHYLDRNEECARDISDLGATEDEVNWGGLSEFSSHMSDVIAAFVANKN
jgi:hypothetical protein